MGRIVLSSSSSSLNGTTIDEIVDQLIIAEKEEQTPRIFSSWNVDPGNDRNRQERNSRHRRLLFQLYFAQTFVGFCEDVVDYGFHVVRPFPDGELAICTGSFMQNSLDVIHLPAAAEFHHFVGDKFDKLMNETARFSFAFLAEIN